MAGAAPTDFQFTRTLNAGPVHCSVWLCVARRRSHLGMARITKKNIGIEFCYPTERHCRDVLAAKVAMLVIPSAFLDLPLSRVIMRCGLHRYHGTSSAVNRIPSATMTHGERIHCDVARSVRDEVDQGVLRWDAALHPFEASEFIDLVVGHRCSCDA